MGSPPKFIEVYVACNEMHTFKVHNLIKFETDNCVKQW